MATVCSAINGLANEYVMQSSEVAGGRNDLFLNRNGTTTPLYIADPHNDYDDDYPDWWMPEQFFRVPPKPGTAEPAQEPQQQ